jgi:hypothetical protein
MTASKSAVLPKREKGALLTNKGDLKERSLAT